MTSKQAQKSILSIAFYLPQFHATPENDRWWGQGFTEWSQVRAWQPYFPGHSLRRPVAPLGEYDLLNPDVFDVQMDIAGSHGIDGFAVWDYWFGRGDRLLEKPVELLLKHKTSFRFCLAWANHSWVNWEKGVLLKKQNYLGAADYDAYYRHSARHFVSPNYLKVDNKPIFIIHDPCAVPDLPVFVERWNTLAKEGGFDGIHFIGERVRSGSPVDGILDGCANSGGFWSVKKKLPWNFLKEKLRTKLKLVVGGPQRYDYWRMVKDSIPPIPPPKFVPTIFTGWDTTPRHGRRGVVFQNFDERVFARHLHDIGTSISQREEHTTTVLIKSWNEWAEGNLLEPDSRFGTALLREYKNFASQYRKYDLPVQLTSAF